MWITKNQNDHCWKYTNSLIKIETTSNSCIEISDIILVSDLKLMKINTSYSHYLKKEGIHGVTFAHFSKLLLVERPTYSFRKLIENKKINLLKITRNNLTEVASILYTSLFLGFRQNSCKYYEEITPKFNKWGITHFLARSGLHLVIVLIL